MSEADPSTRPVAETLSFHETVHQRSSVRAFRPDPVPPALLEAVLLDAQRSPSNCNTQPWQVHIVSGDRLKRLGKRLTADWAAGKMTPDFSFAVEAYSGKHSERQRAQGACYLEAMGVARDDKSGRDHLSAGNLEFFGAPHAAFLFFPQAGDNVRIASDVGMYGQTLLLSLVAHDLGGIPQTMLGFFGAQLREELGLPESMKLLFGISFGYPDPDSPAASYRMPRAPLSESVFFHE
jgi:nitroreductase